MKLIRLRQVMQMTGLGRSSIYNYMKDQSFPKQVKITSSLSAWVETEINEWIQDKVNQRDNNSPHLMP